MSEVWKIHRPTGILVSDKGRAETYIGRPGIQKKKETFGGLTSHGYRRLVLDGKEYKVHRLVLETFKPNKYPWLYDVVAHIDRNRQNNNLKNLRWSNATLSSINTKKESVRKRASGKWQAQICLYGKSVFLGTYSNKQEAIEVAKRAKEAAREIIEY